MAKKKYEIVINQDDAIMTYEFEAEESLLDSQQQGDNHITGFVKLSIAGGQIYRTFEGIFSVNFQTKLVIFIRGVQKKYSKNNQLLCLEEGVFSKYNLLCSDAIDKDNPECCRQITYLPDGTIFYIEDGLFVAGRLVAGKKIQHLPYDDDWKKIYYKGRFIYKVEPDAYLGSDLMMFNNGRPHSPDFVFIAIKPDHTIVITRGFNNGHVISPVFAVTLRDKRLYSVSLLPSLLASTFIWQAKLNGVNEVVLDNPHAYALNAATIKQNIIDIIRLLSDPETIKDLFTNFIQEKVIDMRTTKSCSATSMEDLEKNIEEGLMLLGEQEIELTIKTSNITNDLKKEVLLLDGLVGTLVEGQLNEFGLLTGNVVIDNIKLTGGKFVRKVSGFFCSHVLQYGEIMDFCDTFVVKSLTIPENKNDPVTLVERYVIKEVTTKFLMNNHVWQDVISGVPDDVFVEKIIINKETSVYMKYLGCLRNKQPHGNGIQLLTSKNGDTKKITGVFADGELISNIKIEAFSEDNVQTVSSTIKVLGDMKSIPTPDGFNINFFHGSGNCTTTFKTKESEDYQETMEGKFANYAIQYGTIELKYLGATKMYVVNKGHFNPQQKLESNQGEREFYENGLVVTQKGRFKNGVFLSGQQERFAENTTEYYIGKVKYLAEPNTPSEHLNVIYDDPQGVLINHNKLKKVITWQKGFANGKTKSPCHQIIYNVKKHIMSVLLPNSWSITCNSNGDKSFKCLIKGIAPKEKSALEDKARQTFNSIEKDLVTLEIIAAEIPCSLTQLLAEDNADKVKKQLERDAARKKQEENLRKIQQEKLAKKNIKEKNKAAKTAEEIAAKKASIKAQQEHEKKLQLKMLIELQKQKTPQKKLLHHAVDEVSDSEESSVLSAREDECEFMLQPAAVADVASLDIEGEELFIPPISQPPAAVAAVEVEQKSVVVDLYDEIDGSKHKLSKLITKNRDDEFIYEVKDENVDTGTCLQYDVISRSSLVKGSHFFGCAKVKISNEKAQRTLYCYTMEGEFLCTEDPNKDILGKPNFTQSHGTIVKTKY